MYSELGVSVLALIIIQHGQSVERYGEVGMVGAQRLFADGEDALCKRNCFRIFSFAIKPAYLRVEGIDAVTLLRYRG